MKRKNFNDWTIEEVLKLEVERQKIKVVSISVPFLFYEDGVVVS